MTNLHWYDWAGLIGVAMILFAYLLLQAGRLRGDALPHQLLNAAGALLILISLLYAFNLSAFLMELAWLAVSIYGIVRGRKQAKRRA
ncbi:MAG: CBU_0592 family membrane protein [Rudaea sp.]